MKEPWQFATDRLSEDLMDLEGRLGRQITQLRLDAERLEERVTNLEYHRQTRGDT